eukprot:COSAG02_NODE_190_length_30025_cov_22.989875_33_plen_120_part_00
MHVKMHSSSRALARTSAAVSSRTARCQGSEIEYRVPAERESAPSRHARTRDSPRRGFQFQVHVPRLGRARASRPVNLGAREFVRTRERATDTASEGAGTAGQGVLHKQWWRRSICGMPG